MYKVLLLGALSFPSFLSPSCFVSVLLTRVLPPPLPWSHPGPRGAAQGTDLPEKCGGGEPTPKHLL